MRWQALIILLAIGLGIIAPPSLPWLADTGQGAAIGTLDVCHSASPALSTDGDMPCIQEAHCLPLPPAMLSVLDTPNTSVRPLFIAFQDERPPQA